MVWEISIANMANNHKARVIILDYTMSWKKKHFSDSGLAWPSIPVLCTYHCLKYLGWWYCVFLLCILPRLVHLPILTRDKTWSILQTSYGFKITQKTVVEALWIQKALTATEVTHINMTAYAHIPTILILLSHYLRINEKRDSFLSLKTTAQQLNQGKIEMVQTQWIL